LGLDPVILAIIALVLVFAAAAMFVVGFVPERVDEDELYGYRERKRQRLLEENQIYAAVLPLIKIFAHYISQIEGKRLAFLARWRKGLRDKLPRSGYLGAYSPNEFLGLCCVAGLGGFVFFLLLTTYMTQTPRPLLAIILGLGAMGLPWLSLTGSISQRLVEIDRRLPYTMDLLVLSMRAGLDFMTALDRVVTQGRAQNPDDPMIQELGVVLQELRVGTARTDALKNLVERVNSDYLESMVGAIIQSEKRGTPLASVLEVQVDTIRKKRSQRIEKEASEAGVKILMPLMFVFSAVVLLIVGMMILRLRSGT
jgi:tight adherence protein C